MIRLYGPFVKDKKLKDATPGNDLYGFLPVENIIKFKENEQLKK